MLQQSGAERGHARATVTWTVILQRPLVGMRGPLDAPGETDTVSVAYCVEESDLRAATRSARGRPGWHSDT